MIRSFEQYLAQKSEIAVEDKMIKVVLAFILRFAALSQVM